ncbi:hypothetical protein SNEBB_004807 [Seison nebaliae]|nr:hypothetical protein SNEBB_004807 [Seison nebaliae]
MSKSIKLEMRMPQIDVNEKDEYVCLKQKLPNFQFYITDFKSIIETKAIHHILLYGCEKIDIDQTAWKCHYDKVCHGRHVIFGWSQKTKEFHLPDNVGFKVGNNTRIKYLLVNIHYKNMVKKDSSGIQLTVSMEKRRYLAGMYLLYASIIRIPPRAHNIPVDMSCKYEGNDMTIFSGRVHTHQLGVRVTAYRYRSKEWRKLVDADPQQPQTFLPLFNGNSSTNSFRDGDTKNEARLKRNDYLMGRCEYTSDRDTFTDAGPNHKDEMCNVYLLYYIDSEKVKDDAFDKRTRYCGRNLYPILFKNNPNIEHHHQVDMNVPHYLPTDQLNMNDILKALEEQRSNDASFHFRSNSDDIDNDLVDETELSFNKFFTNNNNNNNNNNYDRHSSDDFHGNFMRKLSSYDDPSSFLSSSSGQTSFNDDMKSEEFKEKFVSQFLNYLETKLPNNNDNNKNNNNNNNNINQLLFPNNNENKLFDENDSEFSENHQLIKSAFHHALQSSISRKSVIHRLLNETVWKSIRIKANDNFKIKSDQSYDLSSQIYRHSSTQWNQIEQITDIAINPCNTNELYILHRGRREWTTDMFNFKNEFDFNKFPILNYPTIVVLDRETNRIIDVFASNVFYLPHGIFVDHHCRVWITDVALHQIIMFQSTNHNEPFLYFGQKGIPGSGKNRFCQPTDILVDPLNDHIYISDGYCNSRIVHYDQYGNFIEDWGKRKKLKFLKPKSDEFDVPHSLTWLRLKLGKPSHYFIAICVGDRENNRVVCFDPESKRHLRTFISPNHQPVYSVSSLYPFHHTTSVRPKWLQSNRPDDILSTYLSNRTVNFIDDHLSINLLFILTNDKSLTSSDLYIIDSDNNHIIEHKTLTSLSNTHCLTVQFNQINYQQFITDNEVDGTEFHLDLFDIFIGQLNKRMSLKNFKFELWNRPLNDTDQIKEVSDSSNVLNYLKHAFDPDKRYFHTSLIIMSLLAIPVLTIVFIAIIVRTKQRRRLCWYRTKKFLKNPSTNYRQKNEDDSDNYDYRRSNLLRRFDDDDIDENDDDDDDDVDDDDDTRNGMGIGKRKKMLNVRREIRKGLKKTSNFLSKKHKNLHVRFSQKNRINRKDFIPLSQNTDSGEELEIIEENDNNVLDDEEEDSDEDWNTTGHIYQQRTSRHLEKKEKKNNLRIDLKKKKRKEEEKEEEEEEKEDILYQSNNKKRSLTDDYGNNDERKLIDHLNLTRKTEEDIDADEREQFKKLKENIDELIT